LIQLYQDIVEESVLVARSDGAKINEHYKDELIEKLKKYPSNKGSSMLSDRLNNRQIELMAKNGIISKIGKQYQVATPLNDLICKLLKYTNVTNSNKNHS